MRVSPLATVSETVRSRLNLWARLGAAFLECDRASLVWSSASQSWGSSSGGCQPPRIQS
ncbi:hypothetical protein [Spirulina major]|uniref:hypothetical protein n=1 Tax=Spirulina major TaxID=270636 RepID=UPI00158751BE|nr:hypothetical protein [Spirulina major]